MSAPTLPAERLLPSPSDEQAWADPATFAAIAGVTVDLAAHTLAHPVPQHGCPFGWCAGADVPFREPSAELTWREDALVSPVPREVTA